ncbi:MAG: PHB depolymerase family esterase [Candidatus Korobacteraceae bacterium]
MVAQSPSAELRYKLGPGDRMVYRETFDREVQSSDANFHLRVIFSNQVMVLDAVPGRSLVGTQRNRQSAEMLDYHEHGVDTLAKQRPAFEQLMAKRPAHFSDTNLFSGTGQPELPLQVVREANSKFLYALGEVMPVPGAPVQVGYEWDLGVFGLHMRLERFEPVGAEPCAVFADTGTRKDFHSHFTFCPESGHLAKLVFEGQQLEFDGTDHEKITFELTETHHHESPSAWIADPQVQLGALHALLVANSPLPEASVMDAVLKTGPPEAQALALASYYQRGITLPQEALQPLLQSQDAEVRRIANRFQQPAAKPVTQPCELPSLHHHREKPGTTLRAMTSSGSGKAPYVVHVPVDYRGDQPFPLIVYLSGGGGLAFDAALSSAEAVTHAGYLVVYPNAGGVMWWEPKTSDMVHTLMLEVLQTYNVDTNRVYLAGFSNGGTGSIELGTRWPDRFAAIASLMGAGLDTPSGTKLPLQNLHDVPVLFLHGDKDPLIPSSVSTRTYDELRGLKPRVSPELHILKGRAHDITLSSDDGLTLPFFERYTRDPFPKTVSAKIFDARYPRQYWLEVVEPGNGEPEVDARILPGNTIEIKARNVKKLGLLLRPELITDAGPVHIRLNGKEQPAVELKHDCQLLVRSRESYADPFLAYTDEIVLDVMK